MLLFGSWISFQRREKQHLSVDAFAQQVHFSREWVVALERGLLYPATREFVNLKVVIGTVDGKTPLEMFFTLCGDPWGKEADAIRQQSGIEHPKSTEISSAEPGDAPAMAIIGHIRYRERLLTVAPWILLLGILGIIVCGQPWSLTYMHFDFPDAGTIAFLGPGIIAGFSLLLPLGSRLLDRSVATTRSSSRIWRDLNIDHDTACR